VTFTVDHDPSAVVPVTAFARERLQPDDLRISIAANVFDGNKRPSRLVVIE
jgi:hypothetical protein